MFLVIPVVIGILGFRIFTNEMVVARNLYDRGEKQQAGRLWEQIGSTASSNLV